MVLQLAPEAENFMGVPNRTDWPDSAGVILISVPFEQTSTFISGSKSGPKAIIAASHQVELHDTRLGFSPFEASGGIATLSPLPVTGENGESLVQSLSDEVGNWLRKGKTVITLGGEHTSVVGSIKAHSAYHDKVTILQLDAHSDLRDRYENYAWNHACTMRRVLDFNPLITQVGIRSSCEEDVQTAAEHNLPVFQAETILEDDRTGRDWISKIISTLSENVYVSLDCDVFDPSVIPATGTPEPGGLDWSQVDRLLHAVSQKRKIKGFDVSELAPIPDQHFPQFTIAKLIYRLVGYMSK
jgi:agmatinase